jgi:DNA (cytosine-5)-methyltransferase 1
LEQAGFEHQALVEIEPAACQTLRLNRPFWKVIESDVRNYSAAAIKNHLDLLAGGVPCPPFSVAGKQLGAVDERDLFPEAIRLVEECRPRAILLENVRGIFDAVFDDYRNKVERQLKKTRLCNIVAVAKRIRFWRITVTAPGRLRRAKETVC